MVGSAGSEPAACAPDRVRTGDPPRDRRVLLPLSYQDSELQRRGPNRSRTCHLSRAKRALSQMSYGPVATSLTPEGTLGGVAVVRALGASRTRTGDVLNVVPLPLGYEGGKLRTEDSNLDDLVQGQAGCRYLSSHRAGAAGE
jgi:hypothetical protein